MSVELVAGTEYPQGELKTMAPGALNGFSRNFTFRVGGKGDVGGVEQKTMEHRRGQGRHR